MELSLEEKIIINHALSRQVDVEEASLVKKMKKCGFVNYQVPFCGLNSDEKFMESAMHYYPDSTRNFIEVNELYEKWEIN